VLLMAPAALAAQQMPAQQRQREALDRLRQVLPAAQADRVVATVNDAIARGLPGLAIAERALEGIAKGRSGEEVAAAARGFAEQLGGSRDALTRGGRTPDASEIEGGATAMSLGVDGETVSALASSAPSGRSLAVPLAVVGALVQRGLPSDGALAAVQARLEARASDLELVDMPGEAGRLIAQGYRPSEVGRAMAALRSGIAAPPAGAAAGGAAAPAGVPTNVGQPGQRPQPPPRPQRPF
jgi:hypothetical protein